MLDGTEIAALLISKRSQIGKVKTIVREIDPNAFVVSLALADAEGGVVKRAAMH